MLQFEVLIFELVPVDRFTASAISFGKVAALDHELLDDTVETGSLITKTFLAGCKSTEVLYSLQQKLWLDQTAQAKDETYFGYSLAIQANDNSAHRFITVLNIEIDLVGDFGAFSCFRSLTKE